VRVALFDYTQGDMKAQSKKALFLLCGSILSFRRDGVMNEWGRQPGWMPSGSAVPAPVSGEVILKTEGLSKRYGERLAVNQLNLEVYRGEVFGFLGPNGAGKTTTIRMLLNLIKPTAGHVVLFGERLDRHAHGVLPRVGALIEMPAFHPYLSGRDNLIAVAGLTGGVPARRIDEVVAMVGLSGRDRDRYSAYSLGMRQRLGVGAALLTEPELLILDEPANGLDPAGIVEMRELIKRLPTMGITVFLSSHILAEVQQICTRVAIIRLGQLIACSPVENLVRVGSIFEIEVDDLAGARALLQNAPWIRDLRIEDNLLVVNAPGIRGRDLNRFLSNYGFVPETIRRRTEDLEQIFLSMTSSNENPVPQGGAVHV
jgi:ABC-2 type transport system ATP-binding protein